MGKAIYIDAIWSSYCSGESQCWSNCNGIEIYLTEKIWNQKCGNFKIFAFVCAYGDSVEHEVCGNDRGSEEGEWGNEEDAQTSTHIEQVCLLPIRGQTKKKTTWRLQWMGNDNWRGEMLTRTNCFTCRRTFRDCNKTRATRRAEIFPHSFMGHEKYEWECVNRKGSTFMRTFFRAVLFLPQERPTKFHHISL